MAVPACTHIWSLLWHRSEMKDLLTDVSPELVDEFAHDFFAGRGRKILHDSKRWRVLDSWIGEPPELHRHVQLCS